MPTRCACCAVWSGSGGDAILAWRRRICRQVQALADAQVTLLSQRRRFSPYGLAGGEPGQAGENLLIRRV